jgi:hypothetical protein
MYCANENLAALRTSVLTISWLVKLSQFWSQRCYAPIHYSSRALVNASGCRFIESAPGRVF